MNDSKVLTKNDSIVITQKVLSDSDESKESVNEKNRKSLLNIVEYVVFTNLVIIEIILYMRKRKRNNVETV